MRIKERFFLFSASDQLILRDREAQYSPISLDFNQMNLDWPKRGIGKSHDVCKAVGLNKLKSKKVIRILDATAGLARDAFIFAKLGADVTMLERHPTLGTMLNTALHQLSDEVLKQKLHFIFIDAADYLQSNDILYDVIYLDPMFSDVNKRAKTKKQMQILQALIGENHDADYLFALALKKAKNRVVIKRHKLSPFLANQVPTHQIVGKSTRYDIYLINARQRCHA